MATNYGAPESIEYFEHGKTQKIWENYVFWESPCSYKLHASK